MNLAQLVEVKFRGDGHRFAGREIERVVLQLLRGFAELEKENVAHCDIKPENILVIDQQALELKICDVGSSKIADSSSFE